MQLDEVWSAIDTERASLADLLDTLTPAQWQAPSLCDGWTVRDVAAHLALAHIGPGAITVGFVRAGGSFNRMMRDVARRYRKPPGELVADIRRLVGSRRHIPGTSYLDPLVDVLVHGQDIAVPSGIARSMPVDAAATAADRVWSMGFPYRARRRLRGLRFVATDVDWARGEGAEVRGGIAPLLVLLTGRNARRAELSGPGVAAIG
jgi:uncharacterized protein (TIGR03083 family)